MPGDDPLDPLDPLDPRNDPSKPKPPTRTLADQYLINPIIPTKTVNLIIGASGAGKTTLMFQWLAAWQRSEPFLGFDSHPTPLAYIALDRTVRSIHRTMDRLGLAHDAFPIFSLLGSKLPLALDSCLRVAPEAHLFIIEGISRMVGGKGINDYAAVADLMCSAQVWCERENRTILGSCHSSKVKEGQQYLNPRERVMGSGAWPAYTETNFFLEQTQPPKGAEMNTTQRDLWILPRNAPEQKLSLLFVDGRLSLAPAGSGSLTPSEAAAWEIISGFPVEFPTSSFVEAMEGLGVHRATAFRLLDRFSDEHLISKRGHGEWQRVGMS